MGLQSEETLHYPPVCNIIQYMNELQSHNFECKPPTMNVTPTTYEVIVILAVTGEFLHILYTYIFYNHLCPVGHSCSCLVTCTGSSPWPLQYLVHRVYNFHRSPLQGSAGLQWGLLHSWLLWRHKRMNGKTTGGAMCAQLSENTEDCQCAQLIRLTY